MLFGLETVWIRENGSGVGIKTVHWLLCLFVYVHTAKFCLAEVEQLDIVFFFFPFLFNLFRCWNLKLFYEKVRGKKERKLGRVWLKSRYIAPGITFSKNHSNTSQAKIYLYVSFMGMTDRFNLFKSFKRRYLVIFPNFFFHGTSVCNQRGKERSSKKTDNGSVSF